MQLYSTRNPQHLVDLREAVFRGLPPDNGLYMPTQIPALEADFLAQLKDRSFIEIGYRICEALFQAYIPKKDIQTIVEKAITFPAPIVSLSEYLHILELFHGPSLAFKDFGARFMAQLMSYFNRDEDQKLIILVATSGDTGGAVAAGFHNTPGIEVVILYPSGKVSPLQEKQLTTLGGNVRALEVDGTFDDCQAMVKSAFLDAPLREQLRLSSANSINIARLIPQSFYYMEAYKQLDPAMGPVSFCIPSGNFGNLTAGLFAQKMGLPVQHFIAATNANSVVPTFLNEGQYQSKPSIATISNAMDVGSPSNFVRMVDLFGGKREDANAAWPAMQEQIKGFSYSDEQTRLAMQEVKNTFNYIIDPHGAVGYLAAKDYQRTHKDTQVVVLETAHPAKFLAEAESTLGENIHVPERLAALADQPKTATFVPAEYQALKDYLLG